MAELRIKPKEKPNTNKTIMKEYRLKKEAKRYVNYHHEVIETLSYWQNMGFSLEDLEEAPKRIEIYSVEIFGEGRDVVKAGSVMENICEQTLNGELFTNLDMVHYFNWFTNTKNKGELNTIKTVEEFKRQKEERKK